MFRNPFAPRVVRILACASAILIRPALALDAPSDFATQLPIATEAGMPYYRFSVPLQAYLASAHGDLRDLRVFNAAGQPVPHARLGAIGDTEESVERHALTWFPLRAPQAEQGAGAASGDGALRVVVRQADDGTLVEITGRDTPKGKDASAPVSAGPRGYVLDASRIADRQAVRALELDWAGSGSDFQLLDVETSDDLQRWTRVASGAQLARLDFNGARIERRRIELGGIGGRYLRLLWREPATAPVLTRVEIEQSRSRYRSPPLAWSAPMAGSATESDLRPGEYRFRFAHPLPVTRLRVELPPGNQMLPLELWSPGRERRDWRRLTSSVAYRITSKGHEWSDNEVALGGGLLREFVLRVDPRLNALAQGPQLSFGVQPETVVFLASGEGPYLLAVGNDKAESAALPASTLLRAVGGPESADIGLATVSLSAAAPHTAPAAATPAPSSPAPAYDWKRIALWSVLALGVVGMAGMAWQLLRQMKEPEKDVR